MGTFPTAVRVAIRLAEWSSHYGLTWIYYTEPEEVGVMQWTGDFELRKLTAKWQRLTTSGVAQDAALCTWHFVNITGGVPDGTWTTADYTTVENAYDTWYTAVKSIWNAKVKLIELNWRADGPAFRPHGTSLAPTLRTVSRSVVGTNTGEMLPPQCAISVTEVTDAKFTVEDVEGVGTQLRNRWGRFYLPSPAVGMVTDGRVFSGVPDTISAATQSFYNTCVAAQIVPVMYSPTTGNAWSVKEVHVDDIFDVIRSRRFDGPLTRAIRAVNPL